MNEALEDLSFQAQRAGREMAAGRAFVLEQLIFAAESLIQANRDVRDVEPERAADHPVVLGAEKRLELAIDRAVEALAPNASRLLQKTPETTG